MHFLQWLQSWPISDWITTSDWGFPIVLTFHSIGLAAVVGILLVLDLRVLGFAKPITFAALERLMAVAWIGFGINTVSGLLLFAADGTRLVTNWPFLLKMVCVIAGVATASLLWRTLKPGGLEAEPVAGPTPDTAYRVNGAARALASASIVIWICAIIFGRVIAYVMDHAILHGGV